MSVSLSKSVRVTEQTQLPRKESSLVLKSLQVEVRLSLGQIKVREYTAWIDNYIESMPKKN